MALCHKWDAKNDFAYVLQFFSLISDGLGSVYGKGNVIFEGTVPSKTSVKAMITTELLSTLLIHIKLYVVVLSRAICTLHLILAPDQPGRIQT